MRKLVIIAVVGLAAQLVDGGLGMGYGVTSTSLLLSAAALTPAVASATVHLSELGTTAASGIAHWRLGNVDRNLVLRLGLPGAIGAFAGATVLSRLSTEAGEPVMALILAALGVYVMLRFALRPPKVSQARTSPHTGRALVPLGLVGGFVDATGGGGWGPVSTTSLLSAGKTAPRTVIGSVDTSEFLVTLAASLGFLVGLGGSGIDLALAGALLAGGLVAAPFAAWLVSRLPAVVLGTAVGGIIVLILWGAFELRQSDPIVDLRSTANRPVLFTNLAAVAIGFGMMAMMLCVPQIMEYPTATGFGLGKSMLEAGLWMMPGGIMMMIFAPVSSILIKKVGPAVTLAIGAFVVAGGYVLAYFLMDAAWKLSLASIVGTVGVAIAYAAMPTIIMSSVPQSETGAAIGLNALMRSLGTTICSAVAAAIISAKSVTMAGHVIPTQGAFETIFVVAAVAALLAGVIALLIPKPQVEQSEQAAPAEVPAAAK